MSAPDPLLIDKVRDIVGLYVNPPDHAVVLCVDEKSQIQALDRTAPPLPMQPGQAEILRGINPAFSKHELKPVRSQERTGGRRNAGGLERLLGDVPPATRDFPQRLPACSHRWQRPRVLGHRPRAGRCSARWTSSV